MGKLSDYATEKMKNGKTAAAQYFGWSLVKGFYDLGKGAVVEGIKTLKDERETIDIDNNAQADDIEKWLNKEGKVKSRSAYLGEGEAYLKARAAMGLNLKEVDKYYQNLSLLCWIFIALAIYCFSMGAYHLVSAKFAFWMLNYFLVGILFCIFYLMFSLDAASILHRKHIDGRVFLKNPSLWLPRFSLPYSWKIKD